MGLLKKIAKKANPVRIIKNAVQRPVQTFTGAVATGGVSLVSNKVQNLANQTVGQLYKPATLSAAVNVATAGRAGMLTSTLGPSGGAMGINLNSILGGAVNLLSGAGFGNIPAATSFMPNYGIPQDVYGGGYPQDVALRLPAPVPAPRPAVPAPRMPSLPTAAVGRRFFDKYPNLATDMQRWANAGKKISRSQLYSWLKRFGQDFLISAGILSAASIAELIMAGPGRRTMNAANPKALRRAARRIKSFHKLCGTADLIRTRTRRTSSRCGTCRKSPCRC